MPISGEGWELFVQRLEEQSKSGEIRTYGRYAVYHDGEEVPDLSGFLCECQGPGDNQHASTPTRKRCIEEGRYKLLTHSGRYASSGYSPDATTPGTDHPLPCLRVENRGARSEILIHPAHTPTLYLSSIGCLNPTSALQADESMTFKDSRSRVVALLDDLKTWSGAGFPHGFEVPIQKAFIVIEEAATYQPTGA